MVSFMEQHAATCEVCLRDPDLKDEMAKITELVLPESKIPKAVRQNSFDEEEDIDVEEEGFADVEEEESLESDIDEEEEVEEDEFLEEDEDGDEV
jgi:hypothetical protein